MNKYIKLCFSMAFHLDICMNFMKGTCNVLSLTISVFFLASPSITWVVLVLVDVTHIHSYLCSSSRYPELLTLVCPPTEFIILVKIYFLRLLFLRLKCESWQRESSWENNHHSVVFMQKWVLLLSQKDNSFQKSRRSGLIRILSKGVILWNCSVLPKNNTIAWLKTTIYIY